MRRCGGLSGVSSSTGSNDPTCRPFRQVSYFWEVPAGCRCRWCRIGDPPARAACCPSVNLAARGRGLGQPCPQCWRQRSRCGRSQPTSVRTERHCPASTHWYVRVSAGWSSRRRIVSGRRQRADAAGWPRTRGSPRPQRCTNPAGRPPTLDSQAAALWTEVVRAAYGGRERALQQALIPR